MKPAPEIERVHETPTRPQVRDLGEARDLLQGWLRAHLPAASDLRLTEIRMPSAAGVANETLLLTGERTAQGTSREVRFVVRVDSDEHLFMGMDIAAHYRIYATMAEMPGVPVPRMIAFESDTALLGERFFAMEHVEGRVPPDRPNFNEEGWVKALRPDQRETLSRNFVRLLANLHAVDPAKFDFLDRPHLGSSGLEQEMRHWLGYAEWCGAAELPIVSASGKWLVEHFPRTPPTEFSWGDARMQNVIFRDDGECAAVLDWDMVSLAGPEADLAWHAISEQGHTASIGKPRLPGIFNPQQIVDLWEEITGRTVRDWDWHLAFAAYRNAVIMVRLAKMLQPKGLLGPGAEYLLTNNGGMQWLAMLLDLPAPGPITRPFVGLDK